jgi:hypothetical protein
LYSSAKLLLHESAARKMGKKQMKNRRSYGNLVNLITAQYYTEYYNNEGGNGVQGLIYIVWNFS